MRTVPSSLQSHLDTGSTTLCFLLKIKPQKGTAFGVTSLDIDVAYDDGGGMVIYGATTGLNLSSVDTTAGMSVSNAEAMMLISSDFSKTDIEAGVLDYADYYVYRVNWDESAQGHYLVQAGRTGIVRSNDELSGVIELRGISQQLKQNYIDQYSLSCRAIFGSTSSDEKFPCNFDTSTLWQSNVVLSVGVEADRQFTATDTPASTGPNGVINDLNTSIIEFLTGDNAGLTVETESVSGDDIELRFQAAYDIQVGDTYRMRPDCQKRFHADCIDIYAIVLNFRGEPYIPLTEESPALFPCAKVKGFGAPQ